MHSGLPDCPTASPKATLCTPVLCAYNGLPKHHGQLFLHFWSLCHCLTICLPGAAAVSVPESQDVRQRPREGAVEGHHSG